MLSLNEYMKTHVPCNLCGSDSTTPLFEKQGFNIVKCKKCGLVYVNPRLSMDDIKKLYQEVEYFNRGEEGHGYRDYLADRELHIKTFEREFDRIERHKKGGKLLDIGCATGFALKVAKGRGWDVYGIEVSRFASEYARKEFSIDVFNGTLEESHYPDKYFDLIISYGTIEHTTEPKTFLKESGRILKDDGLIVIATPDIGNWLGNRKFQYKPLEHLYYFNIDTISKTLRDAGMEVIAYRKMKVNRSLRFHIERLKYYFRRSSSVLNTIESLLKTARLLEISFFIPDGQMVVYAKKVVK